MTYDMITTANGTSREYIMTDDIKIDKLQIEIQMLKD